MPRPRHGGAKSLRRAHQRILKLENQRDRLQAQEVDHQAVLFFYSVAKAIRESVVLEPAFAEEDPEGWREARRLLAEEMADGLEGVYGKFDRDRFLEEATR